MKKPKGMTIATVLSASSKESSLLQFLIWAYLTWATATGLWAEDVDLIERSRRAMIILLGGTISVLRIFIEMDIISK